MVPPSYNAGDAPLHIPYKDYARFSEPHVKRAVQKFDIPPEVRSAIVEAIRADRQVAHKQELQNYLTIERWSRGGQDSDTIKLPFIVVDPRGHGDFTSIKDAIDSIPSTSTVYDTEVHAVIYVRHNDPQSFGGGPSEINDGGRGLIDLKSKRVAIIGDFGVQPRLRTQGFGWEWPSGTTWIVDGIKITPEDLPSDEFNGAGLYVEGLSLQIEGGYLIHGSSTGRYLDLTLKNCLIEDAWIIEPRNDLPAAHPLLASLTIDNSRVHLIVSDTTANISYISITNSFIEIDGGNNLIRCHNWIMSNTFVSIGWGSTIVHPLSNSALFNIHWHAPAIWWGNVGIARATGSLIIRVERSTLGDSEQLPNVSLVGIATSAFGGFPSEVFAIENVGPSSSTIQPPTIVVHGDFSGGVLRLSADNVIGSVSGIGLAVLGSHCNLQYHNNSRGYNGYQILNVSGHKNRIDVTVDRESRTGLTATVSGNDNMILGTFDGVTVTDSGSGNAINSLPPTGPAGGDLAGTYPNPTVADPFSASMTLMGAESIQTFGVVGSSTSPSSLDDILAQAFLLGGL